MPLILFYWGKVQIKKYACVIISIGSQSLWRRKDRINSNRAIIQWQLIKLNTTSETGTVYPSRAPEFIPGFNMGSCYSIFDFVDRCLSFFVWPLCCLFFGLRIRFTPLISSNSSAMYRIWKYLSRKNLIILKCQNNQIIVGDL